MEWPYYTNNCIINLMQKSIKCNIIIKLMQNMLKIINNDAKSALTFIKNINIRLLLLVNFPICVFMRHVKNKKQIKWC